MNASIAVYEKNSVSNPSMYWLHSLLLVISAGFGGGFIAPILMGRPSLPLSNDIILPITAVAWYTTHYIPGATRLLTSKYVKTIWVIFLALFRTHAVCNIVTVATSTLSATPYYPIPLFGPIVVGLLLGCGGQFLPFDKGLTVVQNGTPWVVQGACITATFYHLMITDKTGFLGVSLRNIIGTYSDSTVRVILASMHIITCLSQTLLDERSNLFTPIHKLLYLIFQVNGVCGAVQKEGTIGWDHKVRIALERFIELTRILTVIAILCLHIYITQPPVSLKSGGYMKISDNKGLGSCQMLGDFRSCTPYTMTISNSSNNKYSISTYKGRSGGDIASLQPIWSLNINPKDKKINKDDAHLYLTNNGSIKLIAVDAVSKTETEVWSSSDYCTDTAATDSSNTKASSIKKAALSIDSATGAGIITCSNGQVVKL